MTTTDLVLSSGFLAFASHAGFLSAVEGSDVDVDGVCGTSSGALAGAMWASGMDAATVMSELTRRAPLGWTAPHFAVWRGLFRMDRIVDELRTKLPARIEGLPRPFGVGVATSAGHELVTSGPLAEAVAASCAVPWLFVAPAVDGRRAWDGGVVDRLALGAWRDHRPTPKLLIHLVERSGSGAEADLAGLAVARSPRSGASLWSLGDVTAAFERSRAATMDVLRARDP